MSTFEAQIKNFADLTERQLLGVAKQSAQDVVEDMQKPRAKGGRMRVDTGYLRNSLEASGSSMPAVNASAGPADGATYSYSGSDITAFIAGMKLGSVGYFGYTASYAAAREYGANGQAPDAFVRGAAQKWQTFVNINAQKVSAKSS